MQFDDRFGDCQAHSCALDHHALVAATIEFLKNHLLFHVVNSRTVIRDACDHFRTSQFDSNVNWSLCWRIFPALSSKWTISSVIRSRSIRTGGRPCGMLTSRGWHRTACCRWLRPEKTTMINGRCPSACSVVCLPDNAFVIARLWTTRSGFESLAAAESNQ